MIQLQDLTLARGAEPLIRDASLQIHTAWRVGLVGPNGSGKSSLLALLRGDLQADAGDCRVPKEWRIASVAQETPALARSALDFVQDGDTELRAVEAAIERSMYVIEKSELKGRLVELLGRIKKLERNL